MTTSLGKISSIIEEVVSQFNNVTIDATMGTLAIDSNKVSMRNSSKRLIVLLK